MFDWFDYWLKDATDEVLSRAPVRLFVMGDNAWRDEQEWPLARAVPTPFYLHSGGAANTLDGDGRLSETHAGRRAGRPVRLRSVRTRCRPASAAGTRALPTDQRDDRAAPGRARLHDRRR